MKNFQALFSLQWNKRFFTTVPSIEIFFGDNGEEVTPDPIPNSEVKLFIADGTAHKSVGE